MLRRKKPRRPVLEALEDRTLFSSVLQSIVNNAALTITSNTVYSSITGTGSLTIGTPLTPAVLQLANDGGLSEQSSITINPGSQLDVGNNTFIINYGSQPDPISAIQSYVQSGYNSGSWNGAGIISSVVQAADANGALEGVGYADGADGVVEGLSSGQIELMPTLLGDAKLIGSITFGDVQIMQQHFGQAVGWDEGNFDYQSTVDFGDFQSLCSNFTGGGISGSVYNDVNDDGSFDSGDPGIANVTMQLAGTNDLGSAVSLQTSTASNGSYSFSNLRPGTYTVTETPPPGLLPGIQNSSGSSESLAITGGESLSGVSFGELSPATIGGVVYTDTNDDGSQDDGESGIPSVSMTLKGTNDLGSVVNAQ
ncbi:MAG TPA: SdrD B-like domain-containing protein, partial [Tepidisphaeraceae bacterium]|nr:SdrD B-like domain-containing protein [Tepidisphaeraceae bacterium]